MNTARPFTVRARASSASTTARRFSSLVRFPKPIRSRQCRAVEYVLVVTMARAQPQHPRPQIDPGANVPLVHESNRVGVRMLRGTRPRADSDGHAQCLQLGADRTVEKRHFAPCDAVVQLPLVAQCPYSRGFAPPPVGTVLSALKVPEWDG